MDSKIKAISKGFGEGEIYYTVGCGSKVTKITQGLKPIEYNAENGITTEIVVYNVFEGDKQICEIESNASIILYY